MSYGAGLSLNWTLWREEVGSQWVGAGPIHKTQGSRLAPLIGSGGRRRVLRVERAPGPRGVGRSTPGCSEGAFLSFPGRTLPLAVVLLSPPGWGWYVPPSSHSRPSAPPPSGAVAPPPSWHVRLRKEPNAKFWGPEQGDPPAVDSETYPALLPSPLGRGALRRAEAGSVPVRPGKEERAWRPLPPPNGRYHAGGEERAW